MCLATGFAIALGLAAARADAHFDRQLSEEREGGLSTAALAELELYAPPPEVATAVAVAATTSSAVIAIKRRCPAESLGKLGRRTPIPTETSSAQPTSSPPAM
jgi:hypothetical protein